MIKKEKLLKQLDELIELEKRLIPLFDKHVSSSLAFSGLEKDENADMLKYFKNKATTQQKHFEMLENIKHELNTVRKSDVY